MLAGRGDPKGKSIEEVRRAKHTRDVFNAAPGLSPASRTYTRMIIVSWLLESDRVPRRHRYFSASSSLCSSHSRKPSNKDLTVGTELWRVPGDRSHTRTWP